MTTRPAVPVQFRSPGNGGRFNPTPPVACRRRARLAPPSRRVGGAHGGLLLGWPRRTLVGELGYATVVGAGVGTYGLYLWMR
jgi:hypothetical protein